MKLRSEPVRRARVVVPAGVEARLRADDMVDLTVEVRTAGYVPSGMVVRGRIVDTILTGAVRASDLDRLDADPEVVSAVVSRRVGP